MEKHLDEQIFDYENSEEEFNVYCNKIYDYCNKQKEKDDLLLYLKTERLECENTINSNICLVSLFSSVIALVISILPNTPYRSWIIIALVALLVISIIILSIEVENKKRKMKDILIAIEYMQKK